MQDTSLVPLFNLTNDYCSNYTTGNIDINQRLRAINVAIAEAHRNLGLTCDESIFNFQYVQDNMFTNLPTDFDEPILLYYQNSNYNISGQAGWQWNQYTRLLQNSGLGGNNGFGLGYPLSMYGQKWYSSANINGVKQLLQLGSNILQGSIINPFNTLNGLITGTGDATNLAVDNNVWINVGGSISFTIDPTLGHGYAGILTSGFGIMSVQQAIQQNGINKVWSYLQSTNISGIELIMTSSTGNFYTYTATTQDNNTPFSLQTWFKTQYPWKLATITGNPNSQEITSYEIRYIEGAGFGSTPIPFFRIDDFYLVYPDSMNLVYYSQYKGTDSTGTTKKIYLDALTDIPTFMLYFPDFVNMIALRAAYILMPQLSGDKDFMAMYKADYKEVIADLGRIYPRKRSVNLGQTVLRRP